MKVLKIIVDEMPSNCVDCILHLCHLPLNKHRDVVLKAYIKKRHPNCQLELNKDK